MDLGAIAPWAILSVAVVVFLWVDLKLFARGREPSFREGVVWSIGWLVLSLVAVLVIWPLRGGDDAVEYLTVYLVERSLSLDNLFVFLMLFAYFAVPSEKRPRLLFWGIVAALVMRGLFVLVEGLARRFRYLDETIAVVLGIVGVKLLIEDLVKIGPLPSLAIIAVAFAVGMLLSLREREDEPEDGVESEELDPLEPRG